VTEAGRETLGIEPWVLELLACPDTHHTRLRVDVEAGELVCPTCDRGFRVVDGIPDLLLDEARQRGSQQGPA
jgi:uncharacterized protein YbaR (Trm112 family)